MISLPPGTRVYLACGLTDMRKGFNGLSKLVQEKLMEDPFSGAVFAFRGKAGNLLKVLWWDTQGFCLFAKHIERGKFLWPRSTHQGSVSLTSAQLAMLIEGIDWRLPQRTWQPEIAG